MNIELLLANYESAALIKSKQYDWVPSARLPLLAHSTGPQ